MKDNFYNRGQSLIGIIIVLVAVGLISGGLYYYLSRQIPEVPKISEKTPTGEIVGPEEKPTLPEEKTTPTPETTTPPSETVLPTPTPEKKVEFSGKCTAIFENGSPVDKINIYFYENGFNSDSDLQLYNNYVGKVTAKIFGGSFGGENFPGIEPFKSLKNEFNVFSYADKMNDNRRAFHLGIQDLKQTRSGFVAPTEWGASDGNYNIIVFPSKDTGWPVGTRSTNRLSGTTIRLTAADTIYLDGINLYNIDSNPLAHELGHRIGFLDEEYAFYDLYLGAKPVHPNIDSFSCTKWCQGADTQSVCYQQYNKWLDCFNTKFIEKSNEIQDILQKNNLNYTTSGDYSWWGSCFNARNINICGQKIADVVVSYIRPEVQGLNKFPDQEWVSDWQYCANKNPVVGNNGCNLGLNCGQNIGCYAGASFSRFLPSKEDETFIMGRNATADKFSKHDEEILRYNILNKIRYMDVENIEK